MRRLLPALIACFGLAGCGLVMNTPRYSVHVSNTLALREAGLAKVSIGDIAKDPSARGDVDRVKARAVTLGSPYGSFTSYLREALAAEFDHADLYSASSPIRIDGVLLRNEAPGVGENDSVVVEAELTVTREGVQVYRARKSGRYEWRSTFPGDVAIPRMAANYQTGVQRLIAAFIADPEFAAALRRR
ncbi:MAG: hypothetical protein H7Y89_16715 [Steroidobacteraceae bacterium]|nr:hypothetical protein [Steroidobacteraceae bacterium]